MSCNIIIDNKEYIINNLITKKDYIFMNILDRNNIKYEDELYPIHPKNSKILKLLKEKYPECLL